MVSAVLQFIADIDLLADPVKYLRQGLVDGIDGDPAFDIGVDINVDLGIPGQLEKQVARRQVCYHYAVGFHFGGRARGRKGDELAGCLWDFSAVGGRCCCRFFDVLVRRRYRICSACTEACAGQIKGYSAKFPKVKDSSSMVSLEDLASLIAERLSLVICH